MRKSKFLIRLDNAITSRLPFWGHAYAIGHKRGFDAGWDEGYDASEGGTAIKVPKIEFDADGKPTARRLHLP